MIGREFSDLTERIRSASDIHDVVSLYVSLKRAGRNLKGLCPFHNEKTPSFNVFPEKQIFKCFGCGQGGDVFKFIQLKEGLGFPEARQLLAERAGITIEVRRGAMNPERPDAPGKMDLERVNRWACRWFQKQLWESASAESAREYVASRGINESAAQRFVIGLAPSGWESLRNAADAAKIPVEWLVEAGLLKRRADDTTYDAFRNRLIFPIFDAMSRVIGFGGRALDDDPAKYINSPQNALFDKGRCLFGINTAKEALSKSRSAIVVEGYVDCLLAQQHGFENTVATLGTALTAEHAKLLRRYVDSVTLLFDSDDAGRRAADRSLSVFVSERLDVRVAHVPKGKDPAEMLVLEGTEAFNAVLTSGVDALEFKWNQVRSRYRDSVSGSDRTRAVEEYLSLVSSSQDFGTIEPIRRGLIINQVGKLLGLSMEEVNRQLRIVMRRSSPSTGPVSSNRGSGVRSSDEWTATMREIVSVLLNEPRHFALVESVFDAGRIADAEIRAIAESAIEMIRDGGVFSVARLMSRFESVETASRIAELQSEGERRGNYELAVALCIERVRKLRESESRDELLAALGNERGREALMEEANPMGSGSAADGVSRAKVVALSELSHRVNHFAPRKHLAAPHTKGAD